MDLAPKWPFAARLWRRTRGPVQWARRRVLDKSARDLGASIGRLLLRPFPDRVYLTLGYRAFHGYWPDLDHPATFNEHIQAYMLRCRDPILRIAADKVVTREYVAQQVGSQYLVPLLGVWDRAEDVPLETLPRPCVLKPTAASGLILILREGRLPPLDEVRAELARWLRMDYSRLHREWCYVGLPRRLMAEVMLQEPGGGLPPDYKAYVIGGAVRYIQVDRGRFGHHTRNIYGPQWQPLPARWSLENHAPDPRPDCLEDLVRVAETLARPFEFLRVDFYINGGRLLVGELTNYPGAGFEKFIPASYALHIGSFWKVPPPRRDKCAEADGPTASEGR